MTNDVKPTAECFESWWQCSGFDKYRDTARAAWDAALASRRQPEGDTHTLFDIEPSSGLDRITVILRDLGPSQGQLIVACYGEAWSAYWGAMSGRKIAQFLAGCDEDYVATKLDPGGGHYLLRIVRAVKANLPSAPTPNF